MNCVAEIGINVLSSPTVEPDRGVLGDEVVAEANVGRPEPKAKLLIWKAIASSLLIQLRYLKPKRVNRGGSRCRPVVFGIVEVCRRTAHGDSGGSQRQCRRQRGGTSIGSIAFKCLPVCRYCK